MEVHVQRIKAIGHGKLFDVCDCYVLDGAVRVLSKAGFMALLRGETVGAENAHFDRVVGRLPSRYAGLTSGTNIEFVLPRGGVGHAIDSDTVIEICAAYDEADDADELRANQRHLARGARKLLRAAAKVGLTALVDEATGYDAVRQRGELGRVFNAEMEMGIWQATFPPRLVRRLCELGCAGDSNRGWQGGRHPHPLRGAYHRIYKLVFSEDIAKAMKLANPDPRHGSNHHMLLTEEARDILSKNMGLIVFCAEQSTSKEEFWDRLKSHYYGQRKLAFAS